MTTVSKYRNRRGEVVYAYENTFGAIVAERKLLGPSGWSVRLYISPDEWTSYLAVPSALTAERYCVEHASAMS